MWNDTGRTLLVAMLVAVSSAGVAAADSASPIPLTPEPPPKAFTGPAIPPPIGQTTQERTATSPRAQTAPQGKPVPASVAGTPPVSRRAQPQMQQPTAAPAEKAATEPHLTSKESRPAPSATVQREAAEPRAVITATERTAESAAPVPTVTTAGAVTPDEVPSPGDRLPAEFWSWPANDQLKWLQTRQAVLDGVKKFFETQKDIAEASGKKPIGAMKVGTASPVVLAPPKELPPTASAKPLPVVERIYAREGVPMADLSLGNDGVRTVREGDSLPDGMKVVAISKEDVVVGVEAKRVSLPGAMVSSGLLPQPAVTPPPPPPVANGPQSHPRGEAPRLIPLQSGADR